MSLHTLPQPTRSRQILPRVLFMAAGLIMVGSVLSACSKNRRDLRQETRQETRVEHRTEDRIERRRGDD